jgi:hypothetical protein
MLMADRGASPTPPPITSTPSLIERSMAMEFKRQLKDLVLSQSNEDTEKLNRPNAVISVTAVVSSQLAPASPRQSIGPVRTGQDPDGTYETP